MELTKIRDDEWGILYALPVTLRQVEAVQLRLNSRMGIDAQEHAEMMDETGLFRVTFGAGLSEEFEVFEAVDLEILEGTLTNPEPEWHSAATSSSVVQRAKMFALVDSLIGVDERINLVNQASAPFEAWLAENQEDDD